MFLLALLSAEKMSFAWVFKKIILWKEISCHPKLKKVLSHFFCTSTPEHLASCRA
jgi:hypothetical protein